MFRNTLRDVGRCLMLLVLKIANDFSSLHTRHCALTHPPPNTNTGSFQYKDTIRRNQNIPTHTRCRRAPKGRRFRVRLHVGL